MNVMAVEVILKMRQTYFIVKRVHYVRLLAQFLWFSAGAA